MGESGPIPSAASGTWVGIWIWLLKLTPGSRVPQGCAHSVTSLLRSSISQMGMGDPHQALNNSLGAAGFPHPRKLLLPVSQATKYTSHAWESRRTGTRGGTGSQRPQRPVAQSSCTKSGCFQGIQQVQYQQPLLSSHTQIACKLQAGHTCTKVQMHIQRLFPVPANTQLLNLRGNKFDKQRTKSLGRTSPAPHDESCQGEQEEDTSCGDQQSQVPAAHCCCNQPCKPRENLADKKYGYPQDFRLRLRAISSSS